MPEINDKNIKSVTLTLTEGCNLACSYCYEDHKSKRTMSLETAKKIITEEMTADDGFEFIQIDFFGGEPFLAFNTLKEITEYIRESNFKKPYQLFATTNGTLIHGEIQEWLIKNKDIMQIGLSLDGTREMHNINRCNSFDMIDLDFYKRNYPHQGVKMTISQETLPNLFEGVKFCHDIGLECLCNLAFGIDWSDKENERILEEQLMKLIDYYIENPNIKPCSMIDLPFEKIAYDNDGTTTQKWCGAGTNMHTYDVAGNKYGCQFFMPLSIGEEKAKAIKDAVLPLFIPIELIDEKCQKCVIRDVCPTCYGSNYASTGDLYKKDDNLCKLTKIILKARSYCKALQYEKGMLNLNEQEEQLLLRSIVKIQKELII